ncbi:MAG TPA: universal stress protein [Quisquiliibacterium sp.]|nr:universal stress protein [Quisquiliibacterium sp.]
MSVVCGTDFSAPAGEAAALAAVIARRLDRPLLLVHVLDTRGVLFNQAAVLEALQRGAADRMGAEVARLESLGARVEARVFEGWPDEGLLGAAEERGAELIVLSATGSGRSAHGLLGNTAERVSGKARAPLLMVRDAGPLRAWLEGGPALKVLCGVDDSMASEAAIEWLRRLRLMAPCELLAANIDDGGHAARGLEDRLQRRLGPGAARLVAAPEGVSTASRLAELAAQESADLIVVGSHQRHGLDRALHGSVSIELMRGAPASVLVAPASLADRLPPPPATAGRRVLVATDLSPHGKRAARWALGMLPPGSRIRLLTIVHPRRMPSAPTAYAADDPAQRLRYEAWRDQCRRELEALLPADLQARGLSVEVDAVEGDDAAEAIAAIADAIDADLVCLGTAGRTGLAATLLGSVAQGVLGRSRRPVLLVPDRER